MPTSTIARVTDVVMTGRWMHSAGSVMASAPRPERAASSAAPHSRAVATVTRVPLPSRSWPSTTTRSPATSPSAITDLSFDGAVDADKPQLDGRVRPDHEHVRAVLPDLDRRARHDDRVRLDSERQGDVDELPGPQAGVVVCKLRLERNGAGRDIDLIVDEDQRAGDRGLRLAGDGRDDGQAALGAGRTKRRRDASPAR